jgi:hypothetical protein
MTWPLITLLVGLVLLKFPYPRSELYKSGVEKLKETNDAERVMLENVIPDLEERPFLFLVAWAQIIGGFLTFVGLVWLVWALVT